MTDRRDTETLFAYDDANNSATAEIAGKLSQFKSIDAKGRVGELTEGPADDPLVALHKTTYSWDATGATCREPDDVVDNNLCAVLRDTGAGSTPDEQTQFLYNQEGSLLRERRVNGTENLDTTYGYISQYAQSGSSSTTQVTDSTTGSGNVTTPARPSSFLYYLADRSESLTPRGNAAGGSYAAYRSTYKLDNKTTVSPNAVPASEICTDPSTPSANTGSVCEIVAPKFNGTQSTTTRYRYNTYGEKTRMTTPKAVAEGKAESYVYTYYANTDKDLSTFTSAGGWLKAVTDPNGKFVAFGYDRAGNVVRTWDRNATDGKSLALFPGTVATPPSSAAFTQNLYGSATVTDAVRRPWRFLVSSANQLSQQTNYQVDANGNVIRATSPRGTAAGNSTFDVVQSYDAADHLQTKELPSGSAAETNRFGYDKVGNLTSVTDPLNQVVVFTYDDVNRRTGRIWTRGPWLGDGTEPTACRQSTENDAPIPPDPVQGDRRLRRRRQCDRHVRRRCAEHQLHLRRCPPTGEAARSSQRRHADDASHGSRLRRRWERDRHLPSSTVHRGWQYLLHSAGLLLRAAGLRRFGSPDRPEVVPWDHRHHHGVRVRRRWQRDRANRSERSRHDSCFRPPGPEGLAERSTRLLSRSYHEVDLRPFWERHGDR